MPSAVVRVQDFEVIDTGPRIIETYDCVRNPEPSRPGQLTAKLRTLGRRMPMPVVQLNWQGGAEQVDIHRNGVHRATILNTGSYSEKPPATDRGTYMVCNIDSSACSNAAIALPVRTIDPPQVPLD